MRLAYSYIRFSSPEQKKGDSKRRQLEACEAFCQKHALILETSRSFYDEGKSGFRGKHRTEGALGRFIKLVEDGRVPVGSVLIVEAFDRLGREDTLTAFNLFTSLLKAGVDVVTLVDGQWFSRETINRNIGQLFISLGAVWHAHDYSAVLATRVGNAWAQKQKLAREERKPMTKSCPGWLRMSEGRRGYEVIPERVKTVKLIFWLTLRGWGRERISRLFNRHLDRVPVWGSRKNKAEAWHYSYIEKVLHSRGVLGEFIPHTARGADRKPTCEPIKDYYPAVIDEKTFLRVQNRGPGPRGPRRDHAVNLFQGLLFDGDFPDYSMWFRDHTGVAQMGEWAYVVSDHRRVHTDAPIFTWRYVFLERLILNYLVDLDWSSLTSSRNTDLRKLRIDLETKEAQAAELGRQLKRLVELAKATGEVQELAREITEITSRRDALQGEAKGIRQQIIARNDFGLDDTATLVRTLAADRKNLDNRKRLREVIRGQVARIELFRRLPEKLEGLERLPSFRAKPADLAKSRCVRLLFRNDAERWLIGDGAHEAYGIRLDGVTLPEPSRIVVNRDEMGGKLILDAATDSSVRGAPVSVKERSRKRKKAGARPSR
jgi:DNA invertase Pin-like site-specific DNA recombinase